MALFAALRERPPTPPLESTRPPREHVERVTKAVLAFTASIAGPTVATPPSSSPPQATESSQSTSKKRKRVEWSPWTEYLKAPTFTGGRTAADEVHIKPIAPSRERKSFKSILKSYDTSVPVPTITSSPTGQQLSPGEHKETLAAMLESVVQQLAGEARSSRLDAYLTLNQTLKHYTQFPDSSAIGEKMGLLMQFIQRDLSAKVSPSGALDSALITQALKLLIIFIWKPQLSCHLTDDFRRTMVDRAITALGNPPQPKAVVVHYLHLLSMQRFPTEVLSAERADHIVSILNGLEESVRGMAVRCERLSIYQRLVMQAREVMVSRATDWIDHLFSGMLSSDKEVRTRAIALGTAAAVALGTVGQVSRVVKDMFDRPVKDNTFARCIEQHLTGAIVAKDIGPDVPKIWSVVILFIRSRSRQLEQWDHLKPWLLIIQKCFNSADPVVKMQANVAWNRMIFAIQPRDSTSFSMIKTLRQPIVGQLEKSTSDKNSTTQCHDLALTSLCCLLYYSLRPSARPQQLDIYWEEYVVQIVVKCVIGRTNEVEYGLRILMALFDGVEQRVWKEYRAMDSQRILTEELPRIDTKWVRSRTHTILKICDILFERATWTGQPSQEAPIRQFWRKLTGSIADAGAMEVKLSAELIEATAHVFNLLQYVWSRGPVALGVHGDNAADIFINRFGFLVTTTLESLGPLAFTERLLIRKSKEELEAVGTPSSRSSKHHNVVGESLLSHLFQLLARPRPGHSLTPAYHDLAKTVAEACCRSRNSFGSQLAVLNDCTHFLTAPVPQDDSVKLAWRHLWHVVVELAIPTFCKTARECIPGSEPLTSEYQNMFRLLTNILQHGCRFDDEKSISLWQELFSSLSATMASHSGQARFVQDLIEPLARDLLPEAEPVVSSALLSRATCIIDNISFPEGKTGQEHIKSMSSLYYMMNASLVALYKQIFDLEDAQITLFLLSIKNSIARCPLPMLTTFLNRIQDGLGLWISDGEQKLRLEEQRTSEAYLAMLSIGTEISHAIEVLPHKDSLLLRNVEVLVCSGLQSRCEAISKEARALWNSTFGTQEILEYPARLKAVLDELRSVADLRLPCFPLSTQHEDFIADSRPSSKQDDLVELSNHLGRRRPDYSRAVHPLERKNKFQPTSILSGPSGTPKQHRRIPSLDRHTSDPTTNKRSPSHIAPTRRHQELSRARFDSEMTTSTAACNKNRKGYYGNATQIAVVVESIRRSPAQRTSALDLSIDTDTPDRASAMQISNEAAGAAIFDDIVDTAEDSSYRSGTRSVSPSERRGAVQLLGVEKPSGGITRAQKHNHSSPVSAPIQSDANPRKRRSISTTSAGPAKRSRRVYSQSDARAEEVFDCITVEHSPASNSSGLQQHTQHISHSSLSARCARPLGHNPTVKRAANTGKKRGIDCQDEADDSEHSRLQVFDVTQAGSMGNIDGSSTAKTPSKSIASRVKRRRLAGRRERGLSSEERHSETARTESNDDPSVVEETHMPIAPDASGQSTWNPTELASSSNRIQAPSLSGIERSSSEEHQPNKHQADPKHPNNHKERSTEGVQTVSSNIKIIPQTPAQDCQVSVTHAMEGSDVTPPRQAGEDMNHREDQGSPVGGGRAALTPSEGETGDISTGTPNTQRSPGRPAVAGIIGGLRRILSDLRRAVLGPQEVRQIDDLLFDAKRETFAAERRHDGGGI